MHHQYILENDLNIKSKHNVCLQVCRRFQRSENVSEASVLTVGRLLDVCTAPLLQGGTKHKLKFDFNVTICISTNVCTISPLTNGDDQIYSALSGYYSPYGAFTPIVTVIRKNKA